MGCWSEWFPENAFLGKHYTEDGEKSKTRCLIPALILVGLVFIIGGLVSLCGCCTKEWWEKAGLKSGKLVNQRLYLGTAPEDKRKHPGCDNSSHDSDTLSADFHKKEQALKAKFEQVSSWKYVKQTCVPRPDAVDLVKEGKFPCFDKVKNLETKIAKIAQACKSLEDSDTLLAHCGFDTDPKSWKKRKTKTSDSVQRKSKDWKKLIDPSLFWRDSELVKRVKKENKKFSGEDFLNSWKIEDQLIGSPAVLCERRVEYKAPRELVDSMDTNHTMDEVSSDIQHPLSWSLCDLKSSESSNVEDEKGDVRSLLCRVARLNDEKGECTSITRGGTNLLDALTPDFLKKSEGECLHSHVNGFAYDLAEETDYKESKSKYAKEKLQELQSEKTPFYLTKKAFCEKDTNCKWSTSGQSEEEEPMIKKQFELLGKALSIARREPSNKDKDTGKLAKDDYSSKTHSGSDLEVEQVRCAARFLLDEQLDAHIVAMNTLLEPMKGSAWKHLVNSFGLKYLKKIPGFGYGAQNLFYATGGWDGKGLNWATEEIHNFIGDSTKVWKKMAESIKKAREEHREGKSEEETKKHYQAARTELDDFAKKHKEEDVLVAKVDNFLEDTWSNRKDKLEEMAHDGEEAFQEELNSLKAEVLEVLMTGKKGLFKEESYWVKQFTNVTEAVSSFAHKSTSETRRKEMQEKRLQSKCFLVRELANKRERTQGGCNWAKKWKSWMKAALFVGEYAPAVGFIFQGLYQFQHGLWAAMKNDYNQREASSQAHKLLEKLDTNFKKSFFEPSKKNNQLVQELLFKNGFSLNGVSYFHSEKGDDVVFGHKENAGTKQRFAIPATDQGFGKTSLFERQHMLAITTDQLRLYKEVYYTKWLERENVKNGTGKRIHGYLKDRKDANKMIQARVFDWFFSLF